MRAAEADHELFTLREFCLLSSERGREAVCRRRRRRASAAGYVGRDGLAEEQSDCACWGRRVGALLAAPSVGLGKQTHRRRRESGGEPRRGRAAFLRCVCVGMLRLLAPLVVHACTLRLRREAYRDAFAALFSAMWLPALRRGRRDAWR